MRAKGSIAVGYSVLGCQFSITFFVKFQYGKCNFLCYDRGSKVKSLSTKFMPYINEDGGRLNNYAVEPKVYMAEPPTREEKRNYVILGIGGALVVATVMAIAFFVTSSVG